MSEASPGGFDQAKWREANRERMAAYRKAQWAKRAKRREAIKKMAVRSYSEVGAMLGLNRQHVEQIEYKALKKLCAGLQESLGKLTVDLD